MADLRQQPVLMRELLVHLVKREGVVPYFYCDSEQLVTIAIGYLVDQRNGMDATGKRLARDLAAQPGVRFLKENGARASQSEVEADWERVKKHGRRYKQGACTRISTCS